MKKKWLTVFFMRISLTIWLVIFTAGVAFADSINIIDDNLFGFISLTVFGVPSQPLPADPNDGGSIISGLNINFLGQNYTSGIWSVNGTLELGTASGVAASSTPQPFPDSAIPNNLLAPLWADLDLGAGGSWYLAALSDGVRIWDVVEWNSIPLFGSVNDTASFQIWLEKGTENIWFTYSTIADAVFANAIIGAENATGTVGDTYWNGFSGSGSWPPPDLRVVATAAPVPEPATMLLLGTGLVGVAGAARRRKKNQA